MKITSLASQKSLGDELAALKDEQKALLKRCRQLASSSLGTLVLKEVPSAARWTDDEGNVLSFGARSCCCHRFKDPVTGRTVTRRLGPGDEGLKEKIKLSLLCKKMIPILEYNIRKLEALEASLKDPELSELEAGLSSVFEGVGLPAGAFGAPETAGSEPPEDPSLQIYRVYKE